MMIADIIRDERYAGHMVSHKTAYVDYEGRKQVILPKEQGIIVNIWRGKVAGSDIKSGDDQNAGSCNTGYTSENMDI